MADQKQTNPPADDAPYTLETFVWLMDNFNAKGLFSDADWDEIEKAVADKNEEHLKTVYPYILEKFVRERDININFALQQESLMQEFTSSVEEVNQDVKARQEARNTEIEAAEKEGVEEILEELNIK
jgi:hypothetical protein